MDYANTFISYRAILEIAGNISSTINTNRIALEILRSGENTDLFMRLLKVNEEATSIYERVKQYVAGRQKNVRRFRKIHSRMKKVPLLIYPGCIRMKRRLIIRES